MKSIMDIHCHTVASGHAYSTILEYVKYAKDKGLEVLGISDHAMRMPGSQYVYFFQNLKVIPGEIEGIRLLKGVEANIIDFRGSIDMKSHDLNSLDYAIASLHPPCIPFGSLVQNTEAVIGAIQNPQVRIIGHPDDSRFPLDLEAVVQAAKDFNVLLEINNSSLDTSSYRKDARKNVTKLLELCAKHQASVICSSDAHFALHVGTFDNCFDVLKEVEFPEDLIVNDSLQKLMNFLN